MRSRDDRLAVAPTLRPGVEVAHVDKRVADLVELACQARLAAVLEALTVYVQLPPPFAIVMAPPPEVQARAEVEARCSRDFEFEAPDRAVLHGDGNLTAKKPPVGRV